MSNKIVIEDLKKIINSDLPWENFKNKNVLITGANGFLPSYMVRTLLFLNDSKKGMNINIFALVRNKEKALKKFAEYKNRKDFKLIVQDVCEPFKTSDKIDFIIHSASQASPKSYGKDPVGTMAANTIGTYNLLKLAYEKKSLGFLFFSSSEVYGLLDPEKMPINEDEFGNVNPIELRSCYSESKRAGETLCISWMHQYGVPVTIVRPFHNYGPGMALDDGRIHADIVTSIITKKNIILNSDGKAQRAFCYISDSITGFFTVLLKGEKGVAYNIGNPSGEISIKNLANMMVKLFPELKLKVIINQKINNNYIKSKVSRICPDISKVNSLGWFPKINLKEGFIRTVESYKYD